MLRSAARAKSPEIQSLVDEIVSEETRIALRERREAARIPMSRAVNIRPCDGGALIQAISRDISNLGIGLVSHQPWQRGQVARIEIDCANRTPVVVMAECKWCDEVTDGWHLSGWYFMSVERS